MMIHDDDHDDNDEGNDMTFICGIDGCLKMRQTGTWVDMWFFVAANFYSVPVFTS